MLDITTTTTTTIIIIIIIILIFLHFLCAFFNLFYGDIFSYAPIYKNIFSLR